MSLKLLRVRQPVGLRHAHVGQGDVGLPDGPERALPVDAAGVVPGRALLDEEALDLAVGHVAGPDDDDVGDGAVADPLLLPVDHPGVAVAAG